MLLSVFKPVSFQHLKTTGSTIIRGDHGVHVGLRHKRRRQIVRRVAILDAKIELRFDLVSGDGNLIGYWPFVAYGKNRTRLLNKNESLGDATSTALRDAAAALVSQFRGVVAEEAWKTDELTLEAS